MTGQLRECLCGCGEPVSPTAKFAPHGHDKRLADRIVSQLGGWEAAILIAQGVELARLNAIDVSRKKLTRATGGPS
jgi:hypothetical protein